MKFILNCTRENKVENFKENIVVFYKMSCKIKGFICSIEKYKK